jgi:hypothetical protein
VLISSFAQRSLIGHDGTNRSVGGMIAIMNQSLATGNAARDQ